MHLCHYRDTCSIPKLAIVEISLCFHIPKCKSQDLKFCILFHRKIAEKSHCFRGAEKSWRFRVFKGTTFWNAKRTHTETLTPELQICTIKAHCHDCRPLHANAWLGSHHHLKTRHAHGLLCYPEPARGKIGQELHDPLPTPHFRNPQAYSDLVPCNNSPLPIPSSPKLLQITICTQISELGSYSEAYLTYPRLQSHFL